VEESAAVPLTLSCGELISTAVLSSAWTLAVMMVPYTSTVLLSLAETTKIPIRPASPALPVLQARRGGLGGVVRQVRSVEVVGLAAGPGGSGCRSRAAGRPAHPVAWMVATAVTMSCPTMAPVLVTLAVSEVKLDSGASKMLLAAQAGCDGRGSGGSGSAGGRVAVGRLVW
jgi:hypothetical protein